MKNTPVRIKDIANALNISISTVSRALRGLPEINPATQAAVVRLAEELDYQPNQLAKNLVKSRTKTIGVIVPNLSYYFFSAMINSIQEAAIQVGYSVLVCQSNESYLREVTNIQDLLRGQVEGFIISLSMNTTHSDHIERLIRKNIPLVLFDRYGENINAFKVMVDNQEAAFKATEHLIENGCERIGFLAGPPHLVLSNQRVAGYQAALKKYGLPAMDQYVRYCNYTQDDALLQTLSLVGGTQPPDGLLIISDRIAYPSIYALRQKGIRIPDDIAIVSFNNEPVSALISPSLTSVNQPLQAMGAETVRLLLKQIEASDGPLPCETKVLATELVIRESSVRSH